MIFSIATRKPEKSKVISSMYWDKTSMNKGLKCSTTVRWNEHSSNVLKSPCFVWELFMLKV